MAFMGKIFGNGPQLTKPESLTDLENFSAGLNSLRTETGLKDAPKNFIESATRDNTQKALGKANADFWQGSKQNLKGMANPTNRANLGSQLGNAYNVMDGQVRAASHGDRVGKIAGASMEGVANRGLAAGIMSNAAEMGVNNSIQNAQNQVIKDNGWVNMLTNGLNTGATTYMAGKEIIDWWNEGK